MVQEGLNFIGYAWLLIAIFYLGLSILLSRYLKNFESSIWRNFKIGLFVGAAIHWGLLFYFFNREDLMEPSLLLASSFVSALSVLACLYLVVNKKAIPVVLFALSFTGAGMILGAFFYDRQEVIRLPSLWLWSHVLLMVMGELSFFFATALSSLYLVSERRLKKKGDFRLLSGALSSLPAIEDWMARLLLAGLFFLTGGLILGFFFAKEFWQGEWWYDPKIVLALISWIAYVVLVFARICRSKIKGRVYAWAVIGSFVFAVALSIVANQVPGSIHSPQVTIEDAP